MSLRARVRARRLAWQAVLALIAFIQIVATFTGLTDSLYVVKWAAGIGFAVLLFRLGRGRISTSLVREFGLVVAIIGVGFLSQMGETIDGRAMALAASYLLTATTGFLVAPAALRRRWVRRMIWPALLLGLTAGVLLGEYLGVRDPLHAVTYDAGRWRFYGAFYVPNAAGTAALNGMILAAAAFSTTMRRRYWAPVPLMILVIILANSRGSMIAGGTLLVTWLLLRATRAGVRKVTLGLACSALLLTGIGLRYSGRLDWPDTSHVPEALNRFTSGRWENWQRALSYIDSPLRWTIGLGLSRNLSFMPFSTAVHIPVRGSNADNFYVDLLGRCGLVGLALFFAILGSLAVRIWRSLRRGPEAAVTERALILAVILATLVLGLTDSAIFTWGWIHAMIVWPMAGAAAAQATAHPAPPKGLPRPA